MDHVKLGGIARNISRICLGRMMCGSSRWRDWVLDYGQSKPFFGRALLVGNQQ